MCYKSKCYNKVRILNGCKHTKKPEFLGVIKIVQGEEKVVHLHDLAEGIRLMFLEYIIGIHFPLIFRIFHIFHIKSFISEFGKT